MDWEQILDRLKEYGAEYGPPIIFAILTFIVGRWVARIRNNPYLRPSALILTNSSSTC